MGVSFEQAVCLFAQKYRQRRLVDGSRNDDKPTDWITVKGKHIPLDEKGKALGGAGGWAKGKDFSKAKSVIHYTAEQLEKYIDKAMDYVKMNRKPGLTPEEEAQNLSVVKKAKHGDYFKDSDGNLYIKDNPDPYNNYFINVKTGEQYLYEETLAVAISIQPFVRRRAINLGELTPVKTK